MIANHNHLKKRICRSARRVLATLLEVDQNHHNNAAIMDVSPLAMEMRQSVRDYIQSQKAEISLLGILASNGPKLDDAELYSEFVNGACREDGITYQLRRLDGGSQQIEETILEANECPSIDGILVYYPIYSERGPYKSELTGVYYKSQDDFLRDLVRPEKDVEGLSSSHRKINDLYPCTALSCFKILQDCLLNESNNNNNQCVVTIVNRSEVFGRPLASMLASKGYRVYSIDKNSILEFSPDGRVVRMANKTTLQECIQMSSVIISGVPSPEFSLPCECIPSNAIVMNVSEYENICHSSILEVPGVKFIPQVGKVTIAALEQNLIHLHSKRKQIKR